MLQAMYNGVSAIESNQTYMDVIGNNIANVNTVGFKSSNVNFEDQLSQTLEGPSAGSGTSGATGVGGTDPIQVGLGVRVGSVSVDMSQGGLQSTATPTDMAIQGNGFFMTGSNGAVQYTRDGSFTLDNNGDLVNSANGAFVLGYSATNGVINTEEQINAAAKLNIPVGNASTAAATKNVTMTSNMSADPITTANPTGTFSQNATVYDSVGEPHVVTLNFVPQTAPGATAVSGGGTFPANSTQYVSYAWQYSTPNGGTTTQLAPATQVTMGAAAGSITVTPAPTPPSSLTGANAPTLVWYTGTSPSAMKPITVGADVTVANGVYTLTAPGTGTATGVPTDANGVPVATEWDYYAVGGQSTPASVGQVYFNSAGAEIDPTTILVNGQSALLTKPSITLNYNGTSPADPGSTPQTVDLNFTSATALSGSSNLQQTGNDGFGSGTLQSFSVDPTGTITGIFSNGFSQVLGQIAMANFTNPDGLSSNGNNQFSATDNSGVATIGTPGSGSLGSISTGYLEQSNVDLSSQFADMIVSQQGFDANTKVITTVNTMLGDLDQMVQG